MSRPDPNRVYPTLAEKAYEAPLEYRNELGHRQAAFSQYIVERFRAIGQLGPGCNAKDFYAYLDQRYGTIEEVEKKAGVPHA